MVEKCNTVSWKYLSIKFVFYSLLFQGLGMEAGKAKMNAGIDGVGNLFDLEEFVSLSILEA